MGKLDDRGASGLPVVAPADPEEELLDVIRRLQLLLLAHPVAAQAMFSALVTESVPGHAVGTALTVQTSLGFLLTMVTIQLVNTIASRTGWQWAFAILAFGPAAGIVSVNALVRLQRARGAKPATGSIPSPTG